MNTDIRYKAKIAAVWSMHLLTWVATVPVFIDSRLFKSERLFDFFAKLFSLLPGKPGQYLRASYYMQTLAECHYDLFVGFGSFFSHATARVGRGVKIGSFSIVGTAILEDHVAIGSRVSVLSGKYQHGGGPRGRDIVHNDVHYEQVRIGARTWLGEGAVVMAHVGRHSIVSAGSVITRPVPDNVTAVGNPARVVRFAEPKPESQPEPQPRSAAAPAHHSALAMLLLTGVLTLFTVARSEDAARGDAGAGDFAKAFATNGVAATPPLQVALVR